MSVKISPVYQSTLQYQIRAVLGALNSGDYFTAWNCLETLIGVSPNSVRNNEEVKTNLDDINNRIDTITSRTGLDMTLDRLAQQDGINRLFRRRLRPLFNMVIRELESGGYMELKIMPFAQKQGRSGDITFDE